MMEGFDLNIPGTFHNGLKSCVERKLRRQHFQSKQQATSVLKKITEECKRRRPERK
jgi:hypothetical protein